MLRLTLAALLLPFTATAGVEIQMQGGAFQVTGWSAAAEPAAGWASVFSIYSGGADAPAVIGAYTRDGSALVFRPKWPLTPGLHVRAVFHPAGSAPIETAFDIPKAAPTAEARIEHIYPSTDALPANTLKLYIYFSMPMRRGEAWQHLKLLDEKGAVVELPFLELDQELWDATNTRLTVLFDPGRIKRGLASLNEAGPNLTEGRSYTLVIGRDWLDAEGAPLTQDYVKKFHVTPDQREPVDLTRWKIDAPKPGTREPLKIAFPRPLDYALLQHTIRIAGVAGKVAVAGEETEWSFTPDSPWREGEYQLQVTSTLEDVAGNRVGRLFDVDTFRQVSIQLDTPVVSVPFRIGAQ
jgi:hypothetical protein